MMKKVIIFKVGIMAILLWFSFAYGQSSYDRGIVLDECDWQLSKEISYKDWVINAHQAVFRTGLSYAKGEITVDSMSVMINSFELEVKEREDAYEEELEARRSFMKSLRREGRKVFLGGCNSHLLRMLGVRNFIMDRQTDMNRVFFHFYDDRITVDSLSIAFTNIQSSIDSIIVSHGLHELPYYGE